MLLLQLREGGGGWWGYSSHIHTCYYFNYGRGEGAGGVIVHIYTHVITSTTGGREGGWWGYSSHIHTCYYFNYGREGGRGGGLVGL